MAEQTLFKAYADKYFRPMAKATVDTLNGERKALTYLFKTMLRPEYSPTMKWASLNKHMTNVCADVVTLDSSLPIKKRDSIERASGDIPKVGMKLFKGERDISDINIMTAQGRAEAEIAATIFNDLPKCIIGVYEAMEDAFLRGISTGVALLADENRPGVGVRIDYGIPAENFSTVTNTWEKPTATPITNVDEIIDKASDKGDIITHIMTSKKAISAMTKSTEGKMLYAGFVGSPVTDPTKIAVPTRKAFTRAFEDKYGVVLIEVDRVVRYEKNGKQTPVRPFDETRMVFLTTDLVGTLPYGQLAEETNPVTGVQYTKVDDYILVSKFSKNDPLQEATTSQAIVIPAIGNVDQIYNMKVLPDA